MANDSKYERGKNRKRLNYRKKKQNRGDIKHSEELSSLVVDLQLREAPWASRRPVLQRRSSYLFFPSLARGHNTRTQAVSRERSEEARSQPQHPSQHSALFPILLCYGSSAWTGFMVTSTAQSTVS
ncbi:hypothetical protein HPP92_015695 [Vanilla planifolia]|uniref:Uncharacterized protein n=1 Tax=Vanilla planifolia TaxID=51239 RepID=A0A835QSM6_VANPL|nr:hypothetical protein HPP92_015695 [Vanilla planifolia]